jgi:hypothetical protein
VILLPFLRGNEGRGARMACCSWHAAADRSLRRPGVFPWVVLKMLPFDNKSEFQVVVDMPEGTSLEQTKRVLTGTGRLHLATVPEVSDYQLYAGTASPINFNGLVRQYYLRSGPTRATSRSTWWTRPPRAQEP